MKKSHLYRIAFIVLLIVIIYQSPLGYIFFDKTVKNYFYVNRQKNCLTAIIYNGNILKGIISDYQRDDGMGLYLIPKKFLGQLPEQDYIRLSYIGNDSPIYYKWINDSLYLRIPEWKIIENKLPPTVVLDTLWMDYERWGMYDSDTTRNTKQYLEWQKMKNKYKSFSKYDLE